MGDRPFLLVVRMKNANIVVIRLQSDGLYFLHLFGNEVAVASYCNATHVSGSEAAISLLVHLAAAYIFHTINIYVFATSATTQRYTHKAVESGREVVGDGMVGAVEESRTDNSAHTHGVIAQYII